MLQILRFRNVWPKCYLTRLYTQKISIGDIGADLQKQIDKVQRIKLSGQPPKVWKLVDKMDKNGKLMKFTIQEIPEDRYEDAVRHIYANLLTDELICRILNPKNDPLFIQDISMLWRLLLAEGISIAAFIDDPNGGKPIIAGMNVLGITNNKKDKIACYQFKSKRCKRMFEITNVAHEHYGVDKYLNSIGLSVDPKFRGYRLGEEILKTRDLIGSVYGVPATSSLFTSITSQKSAANVGFEVLLLMQDMADTRTDKNGKKHFPNINSTIFYVMVSIGAIGADLQKEIDKMQRIRPSKQPPKVWKLIEKTDKNGKLMKFTIQDIPEDRYEDAVQHMCSYFLADEPTCNYMDAQNDSVFVQDVSTIWRLVLAEGISIAAFIDDPNGGKPIIAGMNILAIDNKNQKDSIFDYEFKSEKCKNGFDITARVTKMVYERYGVDKYLYSIGLSVDPEFRGYGLGKDILKIRDLIGPVYGVPATSTVFTSIISQESAAGAGFEEFSKQNVADLVDKNGKQYFPGIKSRVFKIMGKRLP